MLQQRQKVRAKAPSTYDPERPVPTRDLRNHRPRDKRLFNDPRLVICRKPTAPPRSRNHLQPANRRRLRLKRMVKRRHKPISDSEIVTIADHQSQQKVGSSQRLHSIDQKRTSTLRQGRGSPSILNGLVETTGCGQGLAEVNSSDCKRGRGGWRFRLTSADTTSATVCLPSLM
jgi:hypothetical protein